MSIWGIFISSYLIGFSGAMMPGPMLGVTIDGSLKKGWTAGPLVVMGHGILELTLISIMAFGLKDFFSSPNIAGTIGLLGGAFLAWMGYGMIKGSIKKTVSLSKQTEKKTHEKNLILSGIIVSATNPYFIMWWASTGMEFFRQAYIWGIMGVLVFFIGHILSDFTWYVVISTTFSKGKKLMNDTVYRWVILFLGVFIIAFAIRFIVGGWKMLFNLNFAQNLLYEF